MQATTPSPALQLNKETVVRFRSASSKPQALIGKNGIVMKTCCYLMSAGSSSMFTIGSN